MSDLRAMIAEYLGIGVRGGDEWIISCPSSEHNDAHASAQIYVGEPVRRMRNGKMETRQPGVWLCFSCHRAGRITNDKIVNYTPSTDRNLEVLTLELDALEGEARVLPEAWLDLFEWPAGIHPYWLSRFPAPLCQRHRLGYDPERDAGTYPFRNPAGGLLGVVHRSFDTEATGWKYRYPKGVDKSANLYGYAVARASAADVVVLVEGALDAVAVDEVGYQGLAIYGSRLSVEQARLIRRLYPATVLFAFDNDNAGAEALGHALQLDLGCFDLRRVDLGTAKDIAELPPTERRRVLDAAHLI